MSEWLDDAEEKEGERSASFEEPLRAELIASGEDEVLTITEPQLISDTEDRAVGQPETAVPEEELPANADGLVDEVDSCSTVAASDSIVAVVLEDPSTCARSEAPTVEMTELDVAIEATMVEDEVEKVVEHAAEASVSSEVHESTDTPPEDSPKKESVDELKHWIRQTSTRLKSFRRDSFKKPVADLVKASPKAEQAKPQAPVKSTYHNFAAATVPASAPKVIMNPTAHVVVLPSGGKGVLPQKSSTIPYEELLRRNTQKEYEGLDQTCLETYLTEDDFRVVFGKSRDEFYAQPKWRQVDQKKKAQLF